jgi:hypothetical protein
MTRRTRAALLAGSLVVAALWCIADSLEIFEVESAAARIRRAAIARLGSPSTRRPAPSAARTARFETTGPDRGSESAGRAFDRMQRALERRDRRELVLSIVPETRAAWLRGMLVELALESTETPSRMARYRTARADMRALLTRRGAIVAERPAELGADALGSALLARVDDEEGLFAELLEFADEHGTSLDPVRAVTGDASTSASSSPLVRLVSRVALPARIVEAHPPSGNGEQIALFVDGPDGRVVVRVVARRGEHWLDES